VRVSLVVAAIVSYLGAGISMVLYSVRHGKLLEDALICLIVILSNLYCGRYLYRKASINKVEWALLGFIANFSAIIIYSLWKSATERWKEGKHFFS